MLCFNMFPQSRPVTSCPQTILTLPQVSKLAHLWCDCSIKFSINWAKWEHDMVSSLFGEWFHMPLWYLLLWWCQAFLEGQNFEQIGQVYPWLDTCLDSMCSQSRVLYLVVHRQSLHCHRSLALHIFADIWASRSAQKRKNREEGTLYFINNHYGTCSCAASMHSLTSKTSSKKDMSSLLTGHAWPRCVPRGESCALSPRGNLCIAKSHPTWPFSQILRPLDLEENKVIKICIQHPLWNLLLWFIQAFFEGQNLAQKGQLYPWLCTWIASTCSQRRVLYLVVHKQSRHCQVSPSFSIFSEIWSSSSTI